MELLKNIQKMIVRLKPNLGSASGVAASQRVAVSPKFFEIAKSADLRPFLLLSIAIHLIAIILHGFMPLMTEKKEPPPPMKVKYVPTPKAEKKPSTLIDAPKPKTIEKPKSTELLSSFDSRVHSNRKPSTKKVYKNKKTVVPKLSGMASLPKKRIEIPQKKYYPPPKKKRIKREFKKAKTGFITSPPEKEVPKKRPITKPVPGGTMAFLDGFDAEKYASLDTKTPDELFQDDDQPISLDTKEEKYASYFARIKHQIERVWVYPDQAARRGVSGKLSLKFRISRDGNLLEVRLVDSSGSNLLDDAAINAVKGASPYYPFPVTIERDDLSILATFIYSPSYKAQYQAR